MPAHDSINPDQLRLFYTGSELKNMITYSGDQGNDEDLDEMWERKTEESEAEKQHGWHGSGVYDSLMEHGWQGSEKIPVQHSGSHARGNAEVWLDEGHHRVAAADAIERRTGKKIFIPVTHHDYGH